MKSINELKGKKAPDIKIDPSMNQYTNMVICPEKVEKAKKTFEKFGLPDLKKPQ